MARNLETLQKQYNSRAAAAGPARGFGPPGPGRGPGRGPGGPRPKGKPKNIRATIARMLSYLKGFKLHLLGVVLCMLGTTVTSLVGGYMIAPIINHLYWLVTGRAADMSLLEQRIDRIITDLMEQPLIQALTDRITAIPVYVLAALAVLTVVYVVGLVTTYVQSRLMMAVSMGAVERIRNDLFEKMQTLPIRYFDARPTGEIMSRYTNDVDNIDVMLNNSLISVVSGIVTLVGTFIFMITTSWILTLVTVVFIPVFLMGGQAIARRSGKYYSGQQAALGAVNGYMEETISGQKVIKVFNHEDECVEEFGSLNDDLRDKQFKAQFYGGIMGPIMHNTSQISYGVTIGLGGILMCFGLLSPGALTVFVNYARQFAMPINNISMQTSTLFAALAGAERVFALMDADPEPADAEKPASADAIRGDVVLENVTFGYNEEKTILHDISLYAHPGQKIAFVGSTGAGKTTVTNLLSRFYDIQQGTITIDGVNIRDYRLSELRQNIAMVLQDTHLFTGTVMENIRYGRLDATDEEVVAAAKTASAHSFIMRLKDGYQTRLEGDGANLPQGQRQQLNIARAALSKAPILVLDEATSSVDTRTERHIEHGMDRLMQDRTTFVIAHRLSTVRHANAILVLEQGRIIERGTHDELLALGGRYYELYTGKKELN